MKVADYSLALYTSSRKPSRTVVSVRWAAPELIVQQPIFTTESDVWSFGKCIIGFCLPRLVIQKLLTSGHVHNQLALVQVFKCCASSMEANLLTVEAVPYSPAQSMCHQIVCFTSKLCPV